MSLLQKMSNFFWGKLFYPKERKQKCIFSYRYAVLRCHSITDWNLAHFHIHHYYWSSQMCLYSNVEIYFFGLRVGSVLNETFELNSVMKRCWLSQSRASFLCISSKFNFIWMSFKRFNCSHARWHWSASVFTLLSTIANSCFSWTFASSWVSSPYIRLSRIDKHSVATDNRTLNASKALSVKLFCKRSKLISLSNRSRHNRTSTYHRSSSCTLKYI